MSAPGSRVLGQMTHIDPIHGGSSVAGHRTWPRQRRAGGGQIRCEEGLGRAGNGPVSRAHASVI